MRLAVLGAGPIGLEVATRAVREGFEVTVYEAGKVGSGMLSWGHLRLFTPWRANTTELGRTVVGDDLLGSEDYPTGADVVRHYLLPLARWLDVRTGHRVKGISRARLLKHEAIGSATRLREPFRLLLDGPMGETTAMADAIVDCTGVLSDPLPGGPSGLPAPGEEALARSGHVVYGPVQVAATERRRVLLVGDGASACSVLRDLLAAGAAMPIWLTHAPAGPGFVSTADDPLPLRRELWEGAAAAVREARVRHLPGVSIEKLLSREDGAVEARLDDGSDVVVDRVVVCTGNRPDLRVARELQVHLCYATEGTMRLAAALLDGGDGDCLNQTAAGADLLRSPEPGYFVLGSKSYGRRNDFLLQAGHRQVVEVMELLQATRAHL